MAIPRTIWLVAGAAAGIALARRQGQGPDGPAARRDPAPGTVDRRPAVPATADDERRVHQRLAATGVDASRITVEVRDGVAVLRGEVRKSADRTVLELAAGGTQGVDEVRSWLHVAGSPPPSAARPRRAG